MNCLKIEWYICTHLFTRGSTKKICHDSATFSKWNAIASVFSLKSQCSLICCCLDWLDVSLQAVVRKGRGLNSLNEWRSPAYDTRVNLLLWLEGPFMTFWLKMKRPIISVFILHYSSIVSFWNLASELNP